MNKKILMSGNEAIGEAAIQAGCRFYYGYPITPQNELTAHMAKRMIEVGGTFIQSESELAAINMVFGSSLTGERAMTSSSSPGISLKQEGISYMAGAELPAVIVNLMRGGPGLGNISGSQADYFQATKGGGHGDYHSIVLAPASLQEAFNLTMDAFDLADKYRTPVIILGDGILAQMREAVELAHSSGDRVHSKKEDWVLRGCKGREPRRILSLRLGEGNLERHNLKLQEKYQKIKNKERRWEEIQTKNAEFLIAAYGTVARAAKEAITRARKEGIAAGLFRPISLWPFPEKRLGELSKGLKKILTLEMSAGQMLEDVRLAVEGRCPVEFSGKLGGAYFTPDEIYNIIKQW